tara:strand:+ start:941 stop:1954 length:1014 start_codon:yes stop_codon:yes gene_type:complete
MLSQQDIDKIDTEKMYSAYEIWPDLAKKHFENNDKELCLSNIDHFIFAGMGGSGTLGDVFGSIMSKTDVHVSVVKGYQLPKTTDENTLVVCTSVSGNTVETMSILEQVKKNNLKSISFSSGGRIRNYCEQNGLEYRFIKENHSPRASFPTFLFTMLKVLKPMLPIKDSDIIESINNLEKTWKNISIQNLTEKNPALSLARWIKGIPIIYYPFGLGSSAIRFRNCLQENTKTHAIIEDIVETSHNGIVAWEKQSDLQPILLRGLDDSIKTSERYEIFKQYFEERDIDYKEVFSVQGDIISKIINLIYFFDYTSIYLAYLRGIDPTPVNSIDFIKSKIR